MKYRDISINLKNKKKIFKLIKDYFSLSKKSLSLFKYNLFYEQETAKEYEFIDKAKDKRIMFPFDDYSDEQTLQRIYIDYRLFTQNFKNEIDKFNISFKHYKKNIISYNKNNHKLIKFVFKMKTINLLKNNLDDKLPIEQQKLLNKFDEKTNFRKIISLITEIREKKEFKNELENIDYEINNLDSIIQEIIKLKNTKQNNLKIVISRNFTDYFLCSTAQNFGSCLNLESDYSGAYWTGLPGLITDKNRAILYITDGNYVNYKGIIGPKMINRSWILTYRKFDVSRKKLPFKEKNFIQLVRSYPNCNNKNSMNDFLKKLFKNHTIITRCSDENEK